MSLTAKKLGSVFEEFLKLPEHVVGEIIQGELRVSPRPAPRHANAAGGVFAGIRDPYHHGTGGPGGWWILPEPEIHLETSIFVPDIAGWKRSNLDALPEEAFFSIAPDWVCEILSPSTATLDRVKKMPLYAHYGVVHLWLVDPLAKTLETYRLENGRWIVLQSFAGNEVIRVEPFQEVEFNLAHLWD